MKRSKTFSRALVTLCAMILSASATTESAPYFYEVLPNTDDDASLEYFSLRNPSCQSATLSGYSVVDASWKAFKVPSNVEIAALSNISFLRPETKITLNNENETLSLFDPFGVLVDSFAYAVSSKGIPLRRSNFSDDVCQIPEFESSTEPSESDAHGFVIPEPDVVIPEPEVLEDGSADAEWTDGGQNDGGPPIENGEIQNAVESPANPEAEAASDTSKVSDSVSSSWSAMVWSWTVSGSWAVTKSGSTNVLQNPPGTSFAQNSVTPSSGTSVSAPASSSPVFPSSTARAVAETLTLHDSNIDGTFDFVEIRYSESVFWTPDPSEFLLYSKTGGLYEHRVSSTWGYFSSATAVGSTLRLAFSWMTLPKTSFRVDSSTSSDFRIKTSSTMSSLKTASSGLPVMPLGLTTSFSWYSTEKIFLVPGFPEVENPEVETDETLAETENDGNPVPGTWTWGVSTIPSDVSTLSEATLSGSVRSMAEKTGSPSVLKTLANVPVPIWLSIVPSSWVDLMPNGKYRLICFSKTCSPSFKVEGLPSKTKWHWLFSDGRKRYGASTSTLGKAVPANYRLAYVVETSDGTAKIPVELSVVPESQVETVKSKADTITKAMASSVSKTSAPKSSATKTASESVKSSTGKISTGNVSSRVQNDGGTDGWQPYRIVSVAVASAFLGLAGWAGWLAYRRRAWLPEETP